MNFIGKLIRMLEVLSEEQKEVDAKNEISNLDKKLDDIEEDISLLADEMNSGYDSLSVTYKLYKLVKERQDIINTLDELKEAVE